MSPGCSPECLGHQAPSPSVYPGCGCLHRSLLGPPTSVRLRIPRKGVPWQNLVIHAAARKGHSESSQSQHHAPQQVQVWPQHPRGRVALVTSIASLPHLVLCLPPYGVFREGMKPGVARDVSGGQGCAHACVVPDLGERSSSALCAVSPGAPPRGEGGRMPVLAWNNY